MIPSEEVCRYLNRVKDSEPWKELYSLIDETASHISHITVALYNGTE